MHCRHHQLDASVLVLQNENSIQKTIGCTLNVCPIQIIMVCGLR